MKKIAVTGGICSGKSTACKLFAELGPQIIVISADQISHKLTQPNMPAYEQIIKHFGPSFVSSSPKQYIDRAKLSYEIFVHNPKNKQWLEDLLHPLIIEHINIQISKLQNQQKICIVETPLLAETKYRGYFDKVIVVRCNNDIQWQRIKERKIPDELAKAIINQQANNQERSKIADYILNNDTNNLEELQNQIKTITLEL